MLSTESWAGAVAVIALQVRRGESSLASPSGLPFTCLPAFQKSHFYLSKKCLWNTAVSVPLQAPRLCPERDQEKGY